MEKASPEALGQIRSALADLERDILCKDASPEKSLEADIAFHNAVIQSTNNILIANIAGYIDRITITSRVRTMQKILASGKQSDFIDLHKRIVEVIENRQAERIAQTVKDHYQFWRLEAPKKQQEK